MRCVRNVKRILLLDSFYWGVEKDWIVSGACGAQGVGGVRVVQRVRSGWRYWVLWCIRRLVLSF